MGDRPQIGQVASQRRYKRTRTNSKGECSALDPLTECEREESRTLPMLLFRRERGDRKSGAWTWRWRLVKEASGNWRPYVRREPPIPFSALDTPRTEAVLAIDPTGSFMISLGGDGTLSEPLMFLRCYGVPSKARLEGRAHGKGGHSRKPVCAPLYQSSLLQHGSAYGSGPSNVVIASPVVSLPVHLVMSRGWDVGMAFVVHDQTPREEIGSVVVFSLRGRASSKTKSYVCSNVRIGGLTSCTPGMQNLLWPTMCISVSTNTGRLVYRTSGYLCLNDEIDGFRMAWATLGGYGHHMRLYDVSEPLFCHQPKSREIIVFATEDGKSWEELVWNDDTFMESPCYDGIRLTSEAYFHVDALLDDIRMRRPKVFRGATRIPDFAYDLISVEPEGRTLLIVIVFDRLGLEGKVIRIAVAVRVDILSGSYEEFDWKRLSGPVSQRSLWESSASVAEILRRKEVNKPYPSLIYSQSDIANNDAVRLKHPVQLLRCRDSAVGLVYG